MDSRNKVSMGFTREFFPQGTHMCLIFNDDVQRRKIISSFLASGIIGGEKVGYFTDAAPEEVLGWLKGAGLSIEDEDGIVMTAESIYYPSGKFVPSEVLAKLIDFYNRAVSSGYAGARMTGEGSFVLRGIPGAGRLMEYEAMINTVSEKYPVTPICQYDARLFDGATLFNVLKVHPMMIVRGRIVRNPFYVRPQEFLGNISKAA